MSQPQFTARTHRARAILEVVSRAYPGAWAAMERFRGMRGTELPRWPEWCYAPLRAAYAVISGGGANRVPFDRVHHVGIVGALAAWRMGQQILRFAPALYAPLIDTRLSGELPTELLYRLPSWCAYIETPDMTLWGRPLHGVWVHLDWSDGEEDELRLLLDQAESPEMALDPLLGLTPVPIILGQGTIADAIQRVTESGARQAAAAGYARIEPNIANAQAAAETLAPLLSLVLYLCSEAPDWSGTPPTNPQPKRTRRDGWRLFPADKVQVWDIGVRVGAALRMAHHAAETGDIETDPETGHARPRAHIRRAHWHTFLAGAGRTERRVKWLPPIPINVDALENLPATERRIA